MRHALLRIFLLLLLAIGVAGCDFIGDVLEFGLWVVLIGLLLIALLIYAVIKAFFD